MSLLLVRFLAHISRAVATSPDSQLSFPRARLHLMCWGKPHAWGEMSLKAKLWLSFSREAKDPDKSQDSHFSRSWMRSSIHSQALGMPEAEAQLLTVSPRSPLLPAGPTGPGAPGAPGAPGGPAGPVSPRSPWEQRAEVIGSVSDGVPRLGRGQGKPEPSPVWGLISYLRARRAVSSRGAFSTRGSL